MNDGQFARQQMPNQVPMSMQQPMLFQANQPLEVTLSAQDWNIVLAGLHELPYRMSAGVVDNLRMQLNSARPAGLGLPARGETVSREPRDQRDLG